MTAFLYVSHKEVQGNVTLSSTFLLASMAEPKNKWESGHVDVRSSHPVSTLETAP